MKYAGIGRADLTIESVRRFISESRKMFPNHPLILDADALNVVSVYPDCLLQRLGEAQDDSMHSVYTVLTPNVVEYGRPPDAIKEQITKHPNLVVIEKGATDKIHFFDKERGVGDSVHVSGGGGMKRCGGIGDVLSGCVATTCAWEQMARSQRIGANGHSGDHPAIVGACLAACEITRAASEAAFQKRLRAMSAEDVLEEIGGAAEVYCPLIASQQGKASL